MSTSGGSRGALAVVRDVLGSNQIAHLGTAPETIAVPNPLGKLLIPTGITLQFEHTDATYDFSGDHLELRDSTGGILCTPTQQIYAVDTTTAEPVTATARATSQMVGPSFVLGTNGNTNPVRTGPLGAVTIVAPGTGYAVNDTGHVNGGNNDALYRVLTVGLLGVVTGVMITAGGSNYNSTGDPRATTTGGAQPGAGVGLTLNVEPLPNGQALLMVAVAYMLITPVI